jgi:hypothetical protein
MANGGATVTILVLSVALVIAVAGIMYTFPKIKSHVKVGVSAGDDDDMNQKQQYIDNTEELARISAEYRNALANIAQLGLQNTNLADSLERYTREREMQQDDQSPNEKPNQIGANWIKQGPVLPIIDTLGGDNLTQGTVALNTNGGTSAAGKADNQPWTLPKFVDVSQLPDHPFYGNCIQITDPTFANDSLKAMFGVQFTGEGLAVPDGVQYSAYYCNSNLALQSFQAFQNKYAEFKRGTVGASQSKIPGGKPLLFRFHDIVDKILFVDVEYPDPVPIGADGRTGTTERLQARLPGFRLNWKPLGEWLIELAKDWVEEDSMKVEEAILSAYRSITNERAQFRHCRWNEIYELEIVDAGQDMYTGFDLGVAVPVVRKLMVHQQVETAVLNKNLQGLSGEQRLHGPWVANLAKTLVFPAKPPVTNVPSTPITWENNTRLPMTFQATQQALKAIGDSRMPARKLDQQTALMPESGELIVDSSWELLSQLYQKFGAPQEEIQQRKPLDSSVANSVIGQTMDITAYNYGLL